MGENQAKNKNLIFGILLILLSALFTSSGQLMWKLGTVHIFLILIGFVLYGIGALLMIGAFRFGEISVLHPMLSVSYILSLVLGAIVLKETITIHKIIGIVLIIIGMIFLGLSTIKRRKA